MKILDATIGRKLPDLDKGYIAYEYPDLWPGKREDGTQLERIDRYQITPSDEKIQAIIDNANRHGNCLLDVESFPIDYSPWQNIDPEVSERAERAYASIIDRIRRGFQGELGIYGKLSPAYSLQSLEFKQAESEVAAEGGASIGDDPYGLVDRVDFICPVLYARGDDNLVDWQKRSNLQIKFSHRWHRPIRPIFWAEYHDEHVKLELRRQIIPWFGEAMEWLAAQPGVDACYLWSRADTPVQETIPAKVRESQWIQDANRINNPNQILA